MPSSRVLRPLAALAAATAAAGAAAPAAHAASCLKPAKLHAVQSGQHALRVTWKAPAHAPKRSSYRVWRDKRVVGQTRKSTMLVPVTPGRRVTVAVGLVGAHGAAPRCAGRIRAAASPSPTAALAAPQSLAVTRASETKAQLEWAKVARAYAYRLMRDGRVVGQTRATAMSAAVSPSRSYRFTVVAVDTRGRASRASNAVTVTAGHRAPGTPTGIGVTAATSASITLAWAPARPGSGPLRGYRVWRDGAVVGQSIGTTRVLDRLAPGHSYEVRVAAVDSQGYAGEPSAPVTVTTRAPDQSRNLNTWAFVLASTDSSFDDFAAHYQQVGTVIPTYFDCDHSTLAVVGHDDPRITGFARQRGVKVTPRFNCQGTAFAHRLVSDPRVRADTISQLVALVERHGYQGINLDIEAGAPADRNGLSTYTAELADALHRVGATLSIDVSPKVADVHNHPRSTFYDYQALSESADQVLVMSWGLHWTTSAPGPVADLTWFQKVYSYVATLPAKDRFVVGQPLYGMDWPAGGGPLHPSTAVDWTTLQALIARASATPVLDPVADEWHFTYTDEQGVGHDVWFFDAKRLQDHMNVAAAKGLAGVAVWRMGQEDPAVWQSTPLGGPGL